MSCSGHELLCSTGPLAAKSAINKVILTTLHKTHVNEYQMLILLSKYQNSNKYLNELNICCSPNFHLAKLLNSVLS